MRAILALALALVSRMDGPLVLPLIMILSGLFSGFQVLDQPARQSWISLIVPRSVVPNAVGLNSIAGNLPLMVGPAIAGILIAEFGVFPSFMVQAVTQWATIVAVYFVRPQPAASTSREPMLRQIAEGIASVAAHPVLSWVVLVLVVSCACVRPYSQLLAALAANVLHVEARGYGIMLTVGGIGTIVGAITTALSRDGRRGVIWFVSGTLTAVCMIFLGYIQNFTLSLVVLAIMGWGTDGVHQLEQRSDPNPRAGRDARPGRSRSTSSITVFGIIPAGTLLVGARWLRSWDFRLRLPRGRGRRRSRHLGVVHPPSRPRDVNLSASRTSRQPRRTESRTEP